MLIRNSADRFPWELSTNSAAALQFMNSHKKKCSNLRAFKEKLFAACGTGSAKDLKIAKNELIDSKGMRNCVASLVNSTDHRGATPLIVACGFGHLNLVEFLLGDCQADVNQLATYTFEIPEVSSFVR